jgi:hypothetical protein
MSIFLLKLRDDTCSAALHICSRLSLNRHWPCLLCVAVSLLSCRAAERGSGPRPLHIDHDSNVLAAFPCAVQPPQRLRRHGPSFVSLIIGRMDETARRCRNDPGVSALTGMVVLEIVLGN